MKIGRILLSIAIATIGIKLSGGVQGTKYSSICNSEYLDVEIINYNTISLPTQLETKEGCVLSVSFTTAARHEYFALSTDKRTQFRIKAKRDGEFSTVNTIYHNDPNNVNTYRIQLTKQLLNNSGSNSKCFIDPVYTQEFCFKKQPSLSSFHIYDLTIKVDSAGVIMSTEQH